jgi:histidinol-phosphatase
MNPDLQLALELADAADAITLRHFQSATLAVRTKVDLTPVSEADEEVERMIRERLAAVRPDDGIVGEEYGVTGSATRRWVIDPIDGTKNYVRGIPVYATLIGLADGDRAIAGVVSAPAMSRRWWASAGDGAFCNGRAMHASRIGELSESHVAYDSVTDHDRHGSADALLSLIRQCHRARGFGDFWIHMLVAEGAIEIAVEPAVAPWDMAAVQVIVEEAGGRFTDFAGNARFDGGSAISTNGILHERVLEHFR